MPDLTIEIKSTADERYDGTIDYAVRSVVERFGATVADVWGGVAFTESRFPADNGYLLRLPRGVEPSDVATAMYDAVRRPMVHDDPVLGWVWYDEHLLMEERSWWQRMVDRLAR